MISPQVPADVAGELLAEPAGGHPLKASDQSGDGDLGRVVLRQVYVIAFEHGVPRECEPREHTYAELKTQGLGARAARHTIKKVRDAYTTSKANVRAGNLGKERSKRRRRAESRPIVFRPESARPYDDRCSSRHIDKQDRADQGLFMYQGCGVVAHADRNASPPPVARVCGTRGVSHASLSPHRGVRTEESIPATSRALPPSPPLESRVKSAPGRRPSPSRSAPAVR